MKVAVLRSGLRTGIGAWDNSGGEWDVDLKDEPAACVHVRDDEGGLRKLDTSYTHWMDRRELNVDCDAPSSLSSLTPPSTFMLERLKIFASPQHWCMDELAV